MGCTEVGCTRPLNRDGLCFYHKMQTIRFGGFHRMKAEREGGYTQAQLAREQMEDFRTSRHEVQQVRGRRTATEKQIDGDWKKV